MYPQSEDMIGLNICNVGFRVQERWQTNPFKADSDLPNRSGHFARLNVVQSAQLYHAGYRKTLPGCWQMVLNLQNVFTQLIKIPTDLTLQKGCSREHARKSVHTYVRHTFCPYLGLTCHMY